MNEEDIEEGRNERQREKNRCERGVTNEWKKERTKEGSNEWMKKSVGEGRNKELKKFQIYSIFQNY